MSREQCPNCPARRGRQEFEDGFYCHACHTQTPKETKIFPTLKKFKLPLSMPSDLTDEFPKHIYDQLKQYPNLNLETVKYSPAYKRVWFPTCSNNGWGRSFDFTENAKWLYMGDPSCKSLIKNSWNIRYDKSLVIVEDIISSCCISSMFHCLFLGGTNLNEKAKNYILKHYKKVIIWLDNDHAGHNAARNIEEQLQLLLPVRKVFTNQDPKYYNAVEIKTFIERE